MKGLIALDIDGTVTPPGQPIALEVVEYLQSLARDQWTIVFVTGRTFHFAHQSLSALPFHYYCGVQNGALIIDNPSRAIVSKKYLDKSIIPVMERICKQNNTDFIIYAGFEHNDVCYYRPLNFSPELRNYLTARTKQFKEKWIEVASFDNLDIDSFASVKCIGNFTAATAIAAQIESELGLHVPLIRDPFDPIYYVAQATHPDVTKGEAVRQMIALLNPNVVIVAGDDYNDITMLEAANIKVVMGTAPADVLKIGDIIAPSAEEHGIIAGLNAAIALSLKGARPW